MQAYVVVSVTPEGNKSVVGKLISDDNYRIEVFMDDEEAEEVCLDMVDTCPHLGMEYYVKEIEL